MAITGITRVLIIVIIIIIIVETVVRITLNVRWDPGLWVSVVKQHHAVEVAICGVSEDVAEETDARLLVIREEEENEVLSGS